VVGVRAPERPARIFRLGLAKEVSARSDARKGPLPAMFNERLGTGVKVTHLAIVPAYGR
jgi:hypothetical protein